MGLSVKWAVFHKSTDVKQLHPRLNKKKKKKKKHDHNQNKHQNMVNLLNIKIYCTH